MNALARGNAGRATASGPGASLDAGVEPPTAGTPFLGLSAAARLWWQWALGGAAVAAACMALGCAVIAHAEALRQGWALEARLLQAGSLHDSADAGGAALRPHAADAPWRAPAAAGVFATTLPGPAYRSEPAVLLDELQTLAGSSGVDLVQFFPDGPAMPARAPGAAAGAGRGDSSFAVQVRGGLGRLGEFLGAVAQGDLALQMLSLRLTAAGDGSGALATAVLRAHDRASLLALPLAAIDGHPADPLGLVAGAFGWADIPAALFGSAPVQAGGQPGVPSGRRDSAAALEATGSAAAPRPGPPVADPVAGARLTGLIGARGAFMALIDLPGSGTHALRPGDTLPGTRLRLVDIGSNGVMLAGEGKARVLEVFDGATPPAAAPAGSTARGPVDTRPGGGSGEALP
ncbi:MAG: hypothetical protein FGM40_03905 [Rhodocyclaceae bacterium]|nr:hypothetical protein [Rhodocyclaceae bacterium]